jgi:hypothetical protein
MTPAEPEGDSRANVAVHRLVAEVARGGAQEARVVLGHEPLAVGRVVVAQLEVRERVVVELVHAVDRTVSFDQVQHVAAQCRVVAQGQRRVALEQVLGVLRARESRAAGTQEGKLGHRAMIHSAPSEMDEVQWPS